MLNIGNTKYVYVVLRYGTYLDVIKTLLYKKTTALTADAGP